MWHSLLGANEELVDVRLAKPFPRWLVELVRELVEKVLIQLRLSHLRVGWH